MRFPQLSAMPASSIREWLDHELEVRGIDAVIYTRYILSILQQDSYHLEPQERDLFPTCGKEKECSSGKGKPKNKQKINKMKFTDCEEMKRSAAVECLMSASEQKCGIEELVDELCLRLKSIHCDADYSSQHESSKSLDVNSTSRDSDLIIPSPEEQAEKYYAAFPALNISPVDEQSVNSLYSSQCNTFWDGKKLLLDNSKGGGNESKNYKDSKLQETTTATKDVKTVTSDDKNVAIPTVKSGDVDAPSERLAIQAIQNSKPIKYMSKHRDHHNQHHCLGSHHYPHHGKTFKSARDHGNGKPSFIVPKFKYGILKQRVPFFKGKSPFHAPQVKLKRFDAKGYCSSKLSGEHQSHSKKIEDNDNNYDSSFEDGDSEDIPMKLSMRRCTSNLIDGDIKLPDNCRSPNSLKEHLQNKHSAKSIKSITDRTCQNESSQHLPTCADDQEVVRKLESKFNENLASIWSQQSKSESTSTNVSEMLESSLMTSLSTWFANLKKCDDRDITSDPSNLAVGSKCNSDSMSVTNFEVRKPFQTLPNSSISESRFDSDEYSNDRLLLKEDFDSFCLKHDKSDFTSNNIPQADSYKERKEDPAGIWYCEGEKHNFIKGGVYGFPKYQNQSDDDCTLSETDLYEISKGVLDNSSPAFESDVDTVVDGRGSKMESKSVREDDVKLIWEVLGATNSDVKKVNDNDDSELLPVCQDDSESKPKEEKKETSKEISIWERLDHFDVWNMELVSLKKNLDSAFPISSTNRHLPTCKDMSILWDESEITTDAVEANGVVTVNQDSSLDIAAFRWGHTESYHQSLWNIWKDDPNDSHDVESLIFECNLPNSTNSEEHLSMTRSYDSYLDKGNSYDGMDSMSRVQDQVRHSDPFLCGRKCTLTYHKGESLFVEVKHQKQNMNKWNNSSRTNLTPGVLKSVEINVATNAQLSTSGNDEQFNLYTSRNSNSTSNELAPYGDEDGYEEENLLTSPKTHFRPIRQLSCDSDDTLNSGDLNLDGIQHQTKPSDDIKVDNSLTMEYEMPTRRESISDNEKPMFTEGESGLMHLSSESSEGEKSCHHYMLYKGLETSKQPTEVISAFVPKFKLRSNLEKFCQTEDLEGNKENRWDSLDLTERSGLNVSLEHNYNEVDLSDIGNDTNNCVSENYSKNGPVLKFLETLSSFENKNNSHSDDDWNARTFENHHGYVVSLLPDFVTPEDEDEEAEEEEEEECEGRDDDSPWTSNMDYSRRDDVDEKDFWAVDDKEDSSESEELKTMKEEIKEEEAELFEDINQMRELDLHNDWDDGDEYSVNGIAAVNDLQGNALEWSPPNVTLYQEVTVDCQEDEDCPELEMINGRQCEMFSPWWLQNEEDGYTNEQDTTDGISSTCADCSSGYREEEALASSTVTSHKFPVLPGGKVLFSSELEEEWMRNGKPFHIQVPKGSHIKTRSKFQKRPCTFYMEGSCRRTDCKFSHDLASITCRFWEEGSCFKGITCPFLHGYPRNPSPARIANKTKQFLLESESDFPSLSKSADSTSSGRWMASALLIKKKKKRNRSRHHSSSVVEEDGTKSKSVELKNP